MSKKPARVSLIIVHYGDPGLLWNLLASLEHHPDKRLVDEVIIVNNGLSLDTGERVRLETYKNLPVKIVGNPQKSYASGVNRGVAVAQGDILIIANNDIEWLPDGSILPLLNGVKEDGTGIVGPQLVYPDGAWQPSHGRFSSLKQALISVTFLDSLQSGVDRYVFHHGILAEKTCKVDRVSGAFMVIQRTCFEELGGFNPAYCFYGEDSDFCWRANRKGWKVLFIPSSRILHIGGASSTSKALDEYAAQYFKAKMKFIREHSGPRQVRWFAWVTKLSCWERAVLYAFIARLISSPDWKKRAKWAKAYYRAARELDMLEEGLS